MMSPCHPANDGVEMSRAGGDYTVAQEELRCLGQQPVNAIRFRSRCRAADHLRACLLWFVLLVLLPASLRSQAQELEPRA